MLGQPAASTSDNQIHPSTIIEGDVRLGKGNKILPHTILIGPLTIGDDNIIGPFSAIGTPGEDSRDPRRDTSSGKIVIGNRNILREYSSISKPYYRDLTSLGDDIFLMHRVHIPHDAIIENKVVMAPLIGMGGITTILEGANLAISSTVHQYGVVGAYSIVAMNAALMHNLKPFARYIPQKPLSVNVYAIEKYGFADCIDEISAYVLDGKPPVTERVLALVERYERYHLESRRKQYY